MQIIIKAKQTQVTPQLRGQIEKKLQRLGRFLNGDSRVEVTVVEEQTRSQHDRFSVQLALSGSIHPIHSEVSAVNAQTALDLVLDKVMAQLGKQKGRVKMHRQHIPIKILSLSRAGALAYLDEDETFDPSMHIAENDSIVNEQENEAIWSRVMEIRSLPTRAMNDQEVISTMENNGASFYPFFNEETNSVNVMYRLETGGYGLLVPALE